MDCSPIFVQMFASQTSSLDLHPRSTLTTQCSLPSNPTYCSCPSNMISQDTLTQIQLPPIKDVYHKLLRLFLLVSKLNGIYHNPFTQQVTISSTMCPQTYNLLILKNNALELLVDFSKSGA